MAKRQPNSSGKPNRLRIVAGNWRGRHLPVLDLPGLRPTSERVRETLFNWLMHWIPQKRCLDLFAGTGALGFEALSRGAAGCTFVERDQTACRQLRLNAASLDAAKALIQRGDAYACLESLPDKSFDLVFLDPPFADADLARLCSLVDRSGILAGNARVYVEQDRDAPDLELPPGWAPFRTATAGNVRYSLFLTGQEQADQ
ncbi:MAG: 16S rRNA (guanine(966)-N(2))-methyltransferase RsmD [Pseudomonadota bacterium]